MKTPIKETENHSYIMPVEGDTIILQKGIKSVSVFNLYGQQLGKLPTDKSEECIKRMKGQPIDVVAFHVGDNGRTIVVDIHFNDNKSKRDAYIIDLQIGRLKSKINDLMLEHTHSFLLEVKNKKKELKNIKYVKTPKKKVPVRGLYYKGKKVIKAVKKKID